METLEVVRRWIWIAFRFEAEWSKRSTISPRDYTEGETVFRLWK